MIEQALYFAIGFLVAALAGIVSLPVVSRRATRLADARARLQAPISEKQAAAERDLLRAQHAVEQVRLERRMILADKAAAGLRAEVGRLSVRMIALEADAAEQRKIDFDHRAQIEALRSDCQALEAALGANQIVSHDLGAQRDRAVIVEAAAVARRTELEAEASRERAKMAILAARAESIEARYEDLSRSAKAAAERAEAVRVELAASLAAQTARARELEARLRGATDHSASLTESVSTGDARREEGRQRIHELESRLRASEKVREETLLENGRQLAALAERETALKAALAKIAALEADWAAISASARANDNAASLRAQTLVTTHAAMEGSLSAARSDREALSRENDALRAKLAALSAAAIPAADDAALRESIKRLGREVNRLFAAEKSIAQDEPDSKGRFPFAGAEAGVLVEPTSGGRPAAFAEDPGRRVARTRAPDR